MKGRWKKREEGGRSRKERKGKGGGLGLCQPPIIPSGLLDFFYGWPPKQGLIKKEARCCYLFTCSFIYSLSLRTVFPYSFVYVFCFMLLQVPQCVSFPHQLIYLIKPYRKFIFYF